jgi:hypothetical protein
MGPVPLPVHPYERAFEHLAADRASGTIAASVIAVGLGELADADGVMGVTFAAGGSTPIGYHSW